MAERYGNVASAFAAGEDDDVFMWVSGATHRARIYDLGISSGDAPADAACMIRLIRSTAAGSGGGAITAVPLDPDAPAASTVVRVGDTTGGTDTVNTGMLNLGLNQRGNNRWAAAPDGEIIVAAHATSGVQFNIVENDTSFTIDAYAHFYE
jgi:hypothetical protein